MNLTTEQLSAIDQDGLVTLSACPGSGKTVVVANRIKRIIDSGNLATYQGVAATSFTRIARDSVLDTFEEVSARISYPNFIGTLDSFLYAYIFKPFSHKLSANSKSFTVLEVDSKWLTEKVLPQLKAHGLEAEKAIFKADGTYGYTDNRGNPNQQQLAWIKEQTRRRNIATWSDVSYYSLELLRNFPEISQNLSLRFPYIIIDEAQDCSDVQMAIVDTLIEHGHQNIMLSGDAHQSIYEWRDADPALFIAKTNDQAWTHCRLSYSQRSGPEICNFLNKFHPATPITSDPSRTILADAEVMYLFVTDPETALSEFLDAATRKNIEITPKNVGVLYRTHKSAMNLRGTPEGIYSWWAITCNGIDTNGHFSLPLLAKKAMINRNYAEAYRHAQRFFYFQFHKESMGSDKQKQEFLDAVETKRILWSFVNDLPDINQALSSWIVEVNTKIESFFKDLHPLTGLDAAIVPLLIKQKRGLTDDPNIQDVFSVGTNEVTKNITLENIHQIKGKTFDAVLIYIEPGTRKLMSANTIKQILGSQEMFSGNGAEDGRCFYVAASRAKRLLCIATHDQELIDVFQA